MKFKIGDKVKFLNEAGGGIVSKIVSPKMVNVAVEDGFDIPTLTSDLVKIEVESKADELFSEDFKVDVNFETPDLQQDYSGFMDIRTAHAKEASGVYLAIVPHDQQFLITGMLDIYVVNHSAHDILFNIYLKTPDGKFSGLDYGSIEPERMHLLETVSREKLDRWKEGMVQLMYHQNRTNEVIFPAHASFKLKQAKFNNPNAYQFSELVDGKAIIISLNEVLHQQKSGSIERIAKEEQVEVAETKAKETKKEAIIHQYMTMPKVAVVDLHIAEIIDNISGMESRDMLAFQKKYFQECLDSAIAEGYEKVTFIHGVGNGVLRTAIIHLLRDYQKVEHQSASMSNYGVGAIDILIYPQN